MWRGPWDQSIVHLIDWSKVDWGTTPAWGAVVVASVAAVFAYRSSQANRKGNENQQKQLEYQGSQLRRLEDDKRQEQAAKVAVWVTTNEKVFKYRIANRSDLPVFDVVVRVDFGHGYPTVEIGSWRVMPPGERDESLPGEYSHIDTLLMATRPPHIYFTDVNTQKWVRQADGKLQESGEELWPSFIGR